MAPATQTIVSASTSTGVDRHPPWTPPELSIPAGGADALPTICEPAVAEAAIVTRCTHALGAYRSEAILTAIDELEAYLEVDTVLRRAVELARVRLGADRAAIFLHDASASLMRGSWGTGAEGETTDEHGLCFSSIETDAAARNAAEFDAGHWLVLERAPHVAHGGSKTSVLGEGWVVVTPIRSEKRHLGVMFNDAALSHAELDPELQGQLLLFCRLLGDVVEARLRHSRLPRPSPVNGTISDLVRQTSSALRGELTLSGGVLAARFGVSAGHLARRFKAEMAISLVDYRNRLRMEKFCDLVQHRRDGIVSAALAAGFGSYAQFHRVFCRVTGMTPREYLALASAPCGLGAEPSVPWRVEAVHEPRSDLRFSGR